MTHDDLLELRNALNAAYRPNVTMMVDVTKPSKEKVRAYMADRSTNESPPDSPEEIRRRLGWGLIPENGTVPEVQE